jgi:Ca2+-binding RTX toxin-like protein
MTIKIKKGTSSNDTLDGENTADLLYGFDGDDYLNGSGGNDVLAGGLGNDVLDGGFGDDKLVGGNGDDILTGGLGIDTLIGGAGNDTFAFSSLDELKPRLNLTASMVIGMGVAAEFDSINDFSLGDRIDLSAIPIESRQFIGREKFSGVAGEVRFSSMMMSGSYLLFDIDGDAMADSGIKFGYVMGVTGTDFISDSITEDSIDSGIFVLDNSPQNQIGTDGNDTLQGAFNGDYLTGGLGADSFVFSEPGFSNYDSYMMSGSYTSITDFDKGDHIVINMPDIPIKFVTRFSGTEGEYTIGNYKDSNSSSVMFDFDGDGSSDSSISVNFKIGGGLKETSVGSNDLFLVPNQLIEGKKSNDNLKGDVGNDTLQGLEGSDTLSGGEGDDSLDGGAGDDVLIGGAGNNTLTGGTGKDTFKFLNPSYGQQEVGSITDFNKAEKDKIDLSAIDANTNVKADQSFSFIGQKAYSGKAGELRCDTDRIYADVNGDKTDDFSIVISGAVDYATTYPYKSVLAATDFVL